MPEAARIEVDLRDVVLPDSRTPDASPHRLGDRPGVQVLTLIRHRY